MWWKQGSSLYIHEDRQKVSSLLFIPIRFVITKEYTDKHVCSDAFVIFKVFEI